MRPPTAGDQTRTVHEMHSGVVGALGTLPRRTGASRGEPRAEHEPHAGDFMAISLHRRELDAIILSTTDRRAPDRALCVFARSPFGYRAAIVFYRFTRASSDPQEERAFWGPWTHDACLEGIPSITCRAIGASWSITVPVHETSWQDPVTLAPADITCLTPEIQATLEDVLPVPISNPNERTPSGLIATRHLYPEGYWRADVQTLSAYALQRLSLAISLGHHETMRHLCDAISARSLGTWLDSVMSSEQSFSWEERKLLSHVGISLAMLYRAVRQQDGRPEDRIDVHIDPKLLITHHLGDLTNEAPVELIAGVCEQIFVLWDELGGVGRLPGIPWAHCDLAVDIPTLCGVLEPWLGEPCDIDDSYAALLLEGLERGEKELRDDYRTIHVLLDDHPIRSVSVYRVASHEILGVIAIEAGHRPRHVVISMRRVGDDVHMSCSMVSRHGSPDPVQHRVRGYLAVLVAAAYRDLVVRVSIPPQGGVRTDSAGPGTTGAPAGGETDGGSGRKTVYVAEHVYERRGGTGRPRTGIAVQDLHREGLIATVRRVRGYAVKYQCGQKPSPAHLDELRSRGIAIPEGFDNYVSQHDRVLYTEADSAVYRSRSALAYILARRSELAGDLRVVSWQMGQAATELVLKGLGYATDMRLYHDSGIDVIGYRGDHAVVIQQKTGDIGVGEVEQFIGSRMRPRYRAIRQKKIDILVTMTGRITSGARHLANHANIRTTRFDDLRGLLKSLRR